MPRYSLTSILVGTTLTLGVGACHVLIGLDDFEKGGGDPAQGGAGGLGAGGAGGMATLAASINCGQQHTCAVRSDGTAECWGLNTSGQLGNGETTDSVVPVPFALGSQQAKDIQAGYFHTCLLLTNGTVQCVGKNHLGQLGNGQIASVSLDAVEVVGISAKSIAAGNRHTCAILTDGTVVCWGENNARQLGDLTSMDYSSVPVAVVGLPTAAIQVTAGREHSCAVLNDATAYCWGANDHAQLGNGILDASKVGYPAQGVMLANVRQIEAGADTTCAITHDDKAYCWGSNDSDETGVGSTADNILEPTEVAGAHAAASISTGWHHTCMVLVDGTVWCWGDNSTGEVGSPLGENILSPRQVADLPAEADEVSTGITHSCVALRNGLIRCWGANNVGQLGDGAGAGGPLPVTPVGY